MMEFKLFKKNAEKQERDDINSIREAILQKLEEYTKTEVVRFELEEAEAGIFDSKIGGAYYVAKDRKPPEEEETNQPMYLLAQVNFGEIPQIESFPEKGLLQIFISSDDMYGCDFDDPYNQKSWRIDYYEELPASVDASCIYEPEWEEDMNLPLMDKVTYRLHPIEDEQIITLGDMHFEEVAEACLDEEMIEALDDDDVFDYLAERLQPLDCQIGGYPFFTQEDPREDDEEDILLFQLASTEEIMWGDEGVGNFFISREDLENRDFSHVMYNWDCY